MINYRNRVRVPCSMPEGMPRKGMPFLCLLLFISVLLLIPFTFGTGTGLQSLHLEGAEPGEVLYDYSVTAFRGRHYVIGGYYKMDTGVVPSMDLFEIKEAARAPLYARRIAGKDYFRSAPVSSFTPLGKINSPVPFPVDLQLTIFNDRVYIEGCGSLARRAWSLLVSDDMLNWQIARFTVPWDTRGATTEYGLVLHKNHIYLSGGPDQRGIWKSRDGNNWTQVPFEGEKIRYFYAWKGRLFVVTTYDRGNTLYTGSGNGTWYEVKGFPPKDYLELDCSHRRIFAVAPHCVYISHDSLNWKLAVNSHAIVPPGRVIDDTLYMNNIEGLNGECFSKDGITWQSTADGGKLSLIPYDMGPAYPAYTNPYQYHDFTVVESAGSSWLVGGTPERLFRSLDGLRWSRVAVRPSKRFLPRSGGAVAAFRGYIYIAGGRWWGQFPGNSREYGMFLNDVWRSRNGSEWERVTADAPWDPMGDALLLQAGGRLVLIGGGRYGGNGTVIQVWESGDGRNWTRNQDRYGVAPLEDSDIRDAYVGYARLGRTWYFMDTASGYDLVSTVDFRRFKPAYNHGDIKDYSINLKNCVTLWAGNREYVILKKYEEFFMTGDFLRWDKLSYGFADSYRGDEEFGEYILHKKGSGLFMVRPDLHEKKIMSVRLALDVRKKALIMLQYSEMKF